ncbi:MAG: cytochrome c oxidase accessory protein CcoG [Gammaproteobacteria bacterium]|nr:cytochrome c oxidase accessory protein CcoG [Gammaproteobacteria bacterium]
MATAKKNQQDQESIDKLYEESIHWHVNTGDETIHAKRVPGIFRNLKHVGIMTWVIFFFGPYLRWNGRQAITFDIPNRQFHFFDITILPQDVWMLSLVLLFLAILLAVVTSVAGRVFCGYFCFQTVWTDMFTWIEEKLEGNPGQRRKLEKKPFLQRKLHIKALKHSIWILMGMLNGITFTLWFGDAFDIWIQFLTLKATPIAWTAVATFAIFTYLFAGFMREQVCLWLCPYARIQGVMLDTSTILPTYDFHRGEPRGHLKKGSSNNDQGDCVSCNQCLAVCPTGIDIRDGQQEGCITCGLCIDACNLVMDKIDKPRGLIRYMSLDELEGQELRPLYKRPRPIIYALIMSIALAGIIYGLTHLGSLELRVIHERQPLFVTLSSGEIQNRYELKILNKTEKRMYIEVQASGIDGMKIHGNEKIFSAKPGRLTSHTLFIKVAKNNLIKHRQTVNIVVTDRDNKEHSASYDSMFFSP